MASLEPEKKQHDLMILQDKHSEYLYKRENEIQDKIEQEQFVTTEEWKLLLTRKLQHLQEAFERKEWR